MRAEVSQALLRRLGQSEITDDGNGVHLVQPLNLEAFALFYAEKMGWPGGESRWRAERSEEATARLLLWLDGLGDGRKQNNAA